MYWKKYTQNEYASPLVTTRWLLSLECSRDGSHLAFWLAPAHPGLDWTVTADVLERRGKRNQSEDPLKRCYATVSRSRARFMIGACHSVCGEAVFMRFRLTLRQLQGGLFCVCRRLEASAVSRSRE